MAPHSVNPKESPKTILKALRVSKSTHIPLAVACSIGLIFSLTLPLDPATAITEPIPSAPVAPPVQTFTVSADVKAPELVRDGYSATTQEELDAKHAAEAEAARVAEEAAAAERAKEQEAARQRSGPTAASTGGYTAVPPTTSYSGQTIVDYAEQFVGVVPYGYGNDPSDSFSCDGLTQYVFGQFGISLGRGVTAQQQQGTRVSADQAQAGDLVVWPGQHVGIYDGHGGIIHSPDFGRKVTHASGLWGSYYFIRIA